MANELDNPSPVLYSGQINILQTEVFRAWLAGLRDPKARLRINDRLKRLAAGNAGDARPVGNDVQELRMRFGPGDRVYYIWRGKVLVVLLNGGDKRSQNRDIAKTKILAKEAEDGIEGPSV